MPIFYLDSGSIDRLEISSSLLVSGSFVLSGSLQTAAGGITGSLLGTASWAQNAVTSSYITTAETASFVTLAQSASYVKTAETASYVQLAQSSSYVLQAVSSSFATTAATASSIGRLFQDVIITGSVIFSGSSIRELVVLGEQEITGSLRITNGVIAQTITGSFTGSLTGDLLGTASWAQNATTAATASSISRLFQNIIITGSTIISGSDQVELFVLGDQQVTGSVRVTNGIIAQTITGSLTGSLTGALIGTASWATNALTASSVGNLNQRVTITGSLIVSGTQGSGVFSKGGTIADFSNLISTSASYFVWRAPYSASVVALFGRRETGSATTAINARRSSSAGYALHTASNLVLGSDNTWTQANSVQNTTYAGGDSLEIIISGSNNRQVAVQVDFIKL